MRWLHITQDEHGFWMLSLEEADGDVGLLAHQFTKPGHLIKDAIELVFGCPEQPARYPDAQIIIDAPRAQLPDVRLYSGMCQRASDSCRSLRAR